MILHKQDQVLETLINSLGFIFFSCAARVGYVIDPYQRVGISDVYLPEHCPVIYWIILITADLLKLSDIEVTLKWKLIRKPKNP